MAHLVEVNGKPVEIVPLSEMSMKELRLVKETTRSPGCPGGMTPSAVAAVLDEMDPDAWLAVLLVSVRRVEPETQVEDLEELGLADLIASLDSGDDEVPPIVGASAPSISSGPPSGGLSTSPSSTDGVNGPETTPEPSGIPG